MSHRPAHIRPAVRQAVRQAVRRAIGGRPVGASGATWAQLFTAMGNPPGGAWPMYTPATMSGSRTGGRWGAISGSDPVGMVLDVSRGGLDALGPETATLNAASWAELNGTVVQSGTGISIASSISATGGGAYLPITTVVGRQYFVFARLESLTQIVDFSVTLAGLSAGVGSTYVFSAAGSLRLVGGWFTAAATTHWVRVPPRNFGSVVVSELSVRELPGNPLQAPTDARRAALGTFAGGTVPCLTFNGSSHGYATMAPIDPAGADEVHVFAAVRSLSDGLNQAIVETNTSVDADTGSLQILRASGDQYRFVSRGTASNFVQSGTGFSQPDNALLYARSKISTPIGTLNRNGTQIATSSATQGTGAYTSQILNVGCRNAASPLLHFNGQMLGLAVIYGPMTPEQISLAAALTAGGAI